LISTYLRDSKWRSGQFDIYVRNTKGREWEAYGDWNSGESFFKGKHKEGIDKTEKKKEKLSWGRQN
jgi:hypothetical protein